MDDFVLPKLKVGIQNILDIYSVVSPGFVKGMGGTSIYLCVIKGRGGNNNFQKNTRVITKTVNFRQEKQ